MGSIGPVNDGLDTKSRLSQRRGSRKRGRDTSGEFDDIRRAIQAMETTFITIHDITQDANILYCSQSITAVLDWEPEEVVGRPCWDFFHPDEVSFAKSIHDRGVGLDKASVLNYCRIKSKSGQWVGCECVFTVVYDVLIGCTSFYLDGPKAKKRAIEAPVIRQLFSSSPKDPRYHMLTYISFKFNQGPQTHIREPRAALFLNRFTLTLTINFATNGLEDLLDISADELQGKSFYYCIQSFCLKEAVRCLESAKANDSIAYLRFWYRDPRLEGNGWHNDVIINNDSDRDDRDGIGPQDSDSEDKDRSLHEEGGAEGQSDKVSRENYDGDDGDGFEEEKDGDVKIAHHSRVWSREAVPSNSRQYRHPNTTSAARTRPSHSRSLQSESLTPDSRESSQKPSTQNTDSSRDVLNRLFDRSPSRQSSTPTTTVSTDSPVPDASNHDTGSYAQDQKTHFSSSLRSGQAGAIHPSSRGMVELEAVISCTSDGLVVVLREARPLLPGSVRVSPQHRNLSYSNGLFASPWAMQPILPDPAALPLAVLPVDSNASITVTPRSAGSTSQASPTESKGPLLPDFMEAIREVAVFAWALTGINGSLQKFGRGKPLMGAIPHSGLPIWVPAGSALLNGEYQFNEAPEADRTRTQTSRSEEEAYDDID